MNSRAKGARVEREAAAFLTSIGFPAERNARNGLSADDIVCPSLPGVHFEVKGDRSIGVGTKALDDAMDQSARDAGKDAMPVVLWREHRKGWRLTYSDGSHRAFVTVADEDIVHVLDWLAGLTTPLNAGKE